MKEKLTIWSSVIMAQLPNPRSYQKQSNYPTTGKYRRIDDLKYRISARQVKVAGKSVEITVNAESLCILEDFQGNLHPNSRRELLKERIPLTEFEEMPDGYQEFHYIVEIRDFYCDALLHGQNLIIIYYLTYMLMATQEQMIILQPGSVGADQVNTEPLIQQDHEKPNALLAENIALRRQLQLYETNLLCIKKSLQKAENNNASLSRELKAYKQIQSVASPAAKANQPDQSSAEHSESAKIIPIRPLDDSRNQMGKRIKNIFLKNS